MITLAVIGVTAAMVMPGIVAKINEKVLLTQVKKEYSHILNALQRYKADSGASNISELFSTSNTSYETLINFSKYFKNPEICHAGDNKGCGGDVLVKKTQPAYDKNGNLVAGNNLKKFDRMILQDGAIIIIEQFPDCVHKYPDTIDDKGNLINKGWTRTYCGSIGFDANGPFKGPNQAGKDYFAFGINSKGEIYDHNTSYTGSITKVLAEDKLNDTVDYQPYAP